METDTSSDVTTRFVTLDVGGTVFHTTKATLTREKDSMLEAMLNGLQTQGDHQTYFIDRDPTHFRYILNYLRDGAECVLPREPAQVEEITAEARYYGLHGLVHLLTAQEHSQAVATDGTANEGVDLDLPLNELEPGTPVVRGPDWRYDDQDGGPGPHIGHVVQVGEDWNGQRCWVHVKWSNGHFNGYRYGIDGAYDVVPAPGG